MFVKRWSRGRRWSGQAHTHTHSLLTKNRSATIKALFEFKFNQCTMVCAKTMVLLWLIDFCSTDRAWLLVHPKYLMYPGTARRSIKIYSMGRKKSETPTKNYMYCFTCFRGRFYLCFNLRSRPSICIVQLTYWYDHFNFGRPYHWKTWKRVRIWCEMCVNLSSNSLMVRQQNTFQINNLLENKIS